MASDHMHVPAGLRARYLRRQLPWLVIAVVLTTVLVVLAWLASVVSEGRIPMMDLLSDPAEVEQIPWYTGAVSDLNLFVWAAAAAMYLIAAIGLRQRNRSLAHVLLWLGLFTVVLTLDDRFLLHEIVVPWLFGLSEIVVFGTYAVVMVAILLVFWRVLIAQPELSILVLGLLGLGVSVLLDVFGADADLRRVLEEAAKLLGTLGWALFPAAIVIRYLSAWSPQADQPGRSQE